MLLSDFIRVEINIVWAIKITEVFKHKTDGLVKMFKVRVYIFSWVQHFLTFRIVCRTRSIKCHPTETSTDSLNLQAKPPKSNYTKLRSEIYWTYSVTQI